MLFTNFRVLALSATLTGLATTSAVAQTEVKIGYALAPTSHYGVAAEKWQAVVEAETDGTPDHVQTRLNETLDTMQMFDDWYGEISRIPRGTQLTLLKLGAKIARFLPGGKSGSKPG